MRTSSERLPVPAQAQFGVIQFRVMMVPQHERLHGHRPARQAVTEQERTPDRLRARAGRMDDDLQFVAVRGAGARDQERRRARVDVGRDAERADVARVAGFHENGLPDAAGGGVPVPLLADGLLGVVHGVLHAQDQDAATVGVERVGQVELERVVATLVPPERLAVAPAFGEEVRRADREDDALAGPSGIVAGDVDFPPIPPDLVARGGAVVGAVHGGGVAEDARGVVMVVPGGVALAPGGEGFPAERDEDLLGEGRGGVGGIEPAFVRPAPVAVEAERPGAVEVEPVHAFDPAALAVGAGVFGAREIGVGRHEESDAATLAGAFQISE